jgi:dihydroorotate dehydrogenase (NAD+) catalytic subunit
MPAKLSVKVGKLKLKNPVLVASGTFGYAEEFKDFINLSQLGAVVTKTITMKPRQGNPAPRTCETPAGMLNSIGLENPGIDNFLGEKLAVLKKIGVPIIVSIASEWSPDEFVLLTERLDKIKEVAAIELNISCPNIGHRTKLISQDAKATYAVVRSVRRATTKTLITKLTPNVTDIAEIAKAAESAGSDAVSLINTVSGMSIDVFTRKAKISMGAAGLSGPAIRPVAVRMVWEVYKEVKIPIIGMGGITDTQSALEFFIAGATAVSVGTANFINPRVTVEIIKGIKDYLEENDIKQVKNLTGALQCRK